MRLLKWIVVMFFLCIALAVVIPFFPQGSENGIVGVLSIIGIGIIYFIPSISAKMRKHPKIESIIILNFFLGWTILGWIGALIWATNEPVKKNI